MIGYFQRFASRISPLRYFQWSREAQSCGKLRCFSPHERDDETNPAPFDQMKLFTQAIFQCHISLCLIHEVGLSRWRHLSSSSQATGGSPDHWAVAPGRRMPPRNICQSNSRGGFAAFPSSINHKETHESYMLESGNSPDACRGRACKGAGIYMQHTLRTFLHSDRVSLWHSSYPYKDFHMPVTDATPLPALLKEQLRANTGKLGSWRRLS